MYQAWVFEREDGNWIHRLNAWLRGHADEIEGEPRLVLDGREAVVLYNVVEPQKGWNPRATIG